MKNLDKYIPSKEDISENASSDWKLYKFKEIVSVKGGQTPSTKDPDNWDGQIAWITPKDVTSGSTIYVSETSRYITEKGLGSKKKLNPPGSVLLTSRAPVGEVVINSVPMATNQGFIGIECSPLVFNKFLFYWLKNNKGFINQNASGTTFREISKSIFKELDILLPPIKKQHLVANILFSLDSKIELNYQMNTSLESLATSLFHSWFVSFDPFKDGEFEESELGKIPKGWKVASVKDFGSIITGKTPSKENKSFYGKDIPFIKTPDMVGNIFVTQTGDSLSVLGAESQKKCTLPKDSIIVNCIGARTGFVSITTEACQTNQQINAIILNNIIYREFVYFSMRNQRKTLRAAGSGGSTMINVNKTTFSNLKLVKPPQHVVEEFSDFSFPLFNKIKNNIQENLLLSSHRDLLLPQLLSAKLRVNNPEKFLEELN